MGCFMIDCNQRDNLNFIIMWGEKRSHAMIVLQYMSFSFGVSFDIFQRRWVNFVHAILPRFHVSILICTFTVNSSKPISALTLILGDIVRIIITSSSILAGIAVTRVDLNCEKTNFKFSIKIYLESNTGFGVISRLSSTGGFHPEFFRVRSGNGRSQFCQCKHRQMLPSLSKFE